jgi:hypothetical protein
MSTNEAFSERGFAMILFFACIICCAALGYRVDTLRSEVGEMRRQVLSENIGSASQTLDNLSLPQNKAFVLCNQTDSDAEVRTFSVAYWDDAGHLRTLNALNRGWKPFPLPRGATKAVQLEGWPGKYAMYAIEISGKNQVQLYVGTSETSSASCIQFKQ